jgi:hypothetical protein
VRLDFTSFALLIFIQDMRFDVDMRRGIVTTG